MVGDLEKSFGDLEKSFSVIWRNRVWRFGEIIFDDLAKSCSAFWRNRDRRIYGDYVLEFVMK